MLSLNLLDSESFVIKEHKSELKESHLNSLTFEKSQLDKFIQSCLIQKKNVLFIKNLNNKQSLSDILSTCYANKERVQHEEHFSFLPHRLKKQKLFNL